MENQIMISLISFFFRNKNMIFFGLLVLGFWTHQKQSNKFLNDLQLHVQGCNFEEKDYLLTLVVVPISESKSDVYKSSATLHCLLITGSTHRTLDFGSRVG